MALRIRAVSDPCLAVWSDSSLYGSRGDLIYDFDLEGYDRHQIHSQWGYFMAFVSKVFLESVDDVPSFFYC